MAWQLVVLRMVVARSWHFGCTIYHPINVALGVAGVELAAAGFWQGRGAVSGDKVTRKQLEENSNTTGQLTAQVLE